MQTANKPENNNKSHEANPSLGKRTKPTTKDDWKYVAISLAMRLCCDNEREANELVNDEFKILTQAGVI